MDISKTIEAKSDQLNAIDFVAGPETVTITEVKKGDADQPVCIHVAEHPGKPFKPSKTVRRVLVSAWGPDASQYAGRRMELFNDPTVRWAGEEVGGIRVSGLSHIDKPLKLSLSVSRGKRKNYVIQPLKEQATPEQPAYDLDALDVDGLRALYMDRKAAGATPDELAQIQAAAQNKENN